MDATSACDPSDRFRKLIPDMYCISPEFPMCIHWPIITIYIVLLSSVPIIKGPNYISHEILLNFYCYQIWALLLFNTYSNIQIFSSEALSLQLFHVILAVRIINYSYWWQCSQ